jgi:tetratricopeptide (TPR) repeat protein
MVKRSPAEKAPARKATRSSAVTSVKSKAKKSATPAKLSKPSKPVKPLKPSPTAKQATQKSIAPNKAVTAKRTASTAKTKTHARKPAQAPAKKQAAKAVSKSKVVTPSKAATPSKTATPKPKSAKQAIAAPSRHAVKPPPQHVPRQPTRDEAAALKAFERAHKEFVRGRFAEAGSMFRALVEKHPGVSEVAARARTYIAVSESRLRREISLPRDADSLYDRGVIELNRGEYVAAQEMFERALKREPEAAHIHYGLAATRARLGSIDSALESLQKALDIQPTLRVRAQHDQDLSALRNDPLFEQLIFAPRM